MGGVARLVVSHFFVEHAHDTILFVHQVLVLVDEDANLILQGGDPSSWWQTVVASKLVRATGSIAGTCKEVRGSQGVSSLLEVVLSSGGGFVVPKGQWDLGSLGARGGAGH